MPIPAGLDAGLIGIVGPSAAFDPEHPNGNGYELPMVLRLVARDGGAVLRQLVILAHVEQYSITPQVRMAVHATAGGFEVDMPEHDARGLVTINLSGNTGVWPIGRGAGKPDGMAWLRALQQFFEQWCQPTVCGLPRDQVEMELVVADAPVSAADPAGAGLYIVVPNQQLPDYSRTARRTAVYAFSIRLLAYRQRSASARAKLRIKRGELSWYQRLLALEMFLNQYSFDQMFLRYQQLIAPALQGLAALNDVKHFLRGYVQGVSTFVGYNVGLLNALVGDITGIEQTINDALGLNEGDRFGADGAVLRGVADLRRQLARTTHALITRQGLRGRSGGGSPDEIGPGVSRQIGAVASPLTTHASDSRRLAPWQLDRGDVRFGQPEALGAVYATVTAGDTLERLRPTGFTDLDVIRLNRLRWPFVDGSRPRPESDPAPAPGDQRVLYLGEPILLPSTIAPASPVARADVAAEGVETDEARIFGVDLRVDPETRNLEWDPATGDLATVAGLDNLAQTLRHLLLMPAGSLPYAPDVGSQLEREAGGTWSTAARTRLLAIMTRQTLAQDPRVASVERVAVEVGEGVTDVEFDLITVDGVARGRLAIQA